MHSDWTLIRDAYCSATNIDSILKKIEFYNLHSCNTVSMDDIIHMRRLAFDKQLDFYHQNPLDLQELVRRINDPSLFYNDIKKYVASSFNIMAFPSICNQLHAQRELIPPSREIVLELLIDNLCERFAIYQSDTFDNI